MNKYLLILLLSCSCSPSQRLGRLVSKHPELVNRDTTFVNDTTIVQGVRVDTNFVFKNDVDTFFLEKDKLRVKIIRVNDTLKVTGECKTDTIYKQVMVETNTVNPVLNFRMKWWWWIVIVIVGAIVFIGLVRKK